MARKKKIKGVSNEVCMALMLTMEVQKQVNTQSNKKGTLSEAADLYKEPTCVEEGKACPACKADPHGFCFDHAPMPNSVHSPECEKSIYLKEELKKGPGEISFEGIECTCGVSKAWEDYHGEDDDEVEEPGILPYHQAVLEQRLKNGYYTKPENVDHKKICSYLYPPYDTCNCGAVEEVIVECPECNPESDKPYLCTAHADKRKPNIGVVVEDEPKHSGTCAYLVHPNCVCDCGAVVIEEVKHGVACNKSIYTQENGDTVGPDVECNCGISTGLIPP